MVGIRIGHRTAHARKHVVMANKNEHGVVQTPHLNMVVNNVKVMQRK